MGLNHFIDEQMGVPDCSITCDGGFLDDNGHACCCGDWGGCLSDAVEESLVALAKRQGWIRRGKKWYCPTCAKEPR